METQTLKLNLSQQEIVRLKSKLDGCFSFKDAKRQLEKEGKSGAVAVRLIARFRPSLYKEYMTAKDGWALI